jgi:hypothetical protein
VGAITEAVGKFAAPAPIPALAAAMTKRWAVIGSEVAGCDGNSGGGSGGGPAAAAAEAFLEAVVFLEAAAAEWTLIAVLAAAAAAEAFLEAAVFLEAAAAERTSCYFTSHPRSPEGYNKVSVKCWCMVAIIVLDPCCMYHDPCYEYATQSCPPSFC